MFVQRFEHVKCYVSGQYYTAESSVINQLKLPIDSVIIWFLM